jgi:hypothetical protein
MLPLIALIFYDISGGPWHRGLGLRLRAGGGTLLPVLGFLVPVLGFLVLSVLWSIPEVLVNVELFLD